MSKKRIGKSVDPICSTFPISITEPSTRSARESLYQYFPTISPRNSNPQLKTYSDFEPANVYISALKEIGEKAYVPLSSLKQRMTPRRLSTQPKASIESYTSEFIPTNITPDPNPLLPVQEELELESSKQEFKTWKPKLDSLKKQIKDLKEYTYLDDFVFNFETTGKLVSEMKKFNGDARLTCLKSLYYSLELFQKSIEQIIFVKNNFEKEIENLAGEKFSLLRNLEKEKTLNDIKITGKKAHKSKESKNSQEIGVVADSVHRKVELEKEKLAEKVEQLEKYVADLKDFTKVENLEQELIDYRDKHSKMSKGFKVYKLEKEKIIYSMELQIGELREKIASNSIFMKDFNEIKESFELKNHNLQLRVQQLTEESSSLRESMKMFSEDMTRYLIFKEMYEKSLDQLNTMRYKYNQLELNIAAGSVPLNKDGIIWIPLDDPLFAIVRNIPAQIENNKMMAISEKVEFEKEKSKIGAKHDYSTVGQRRNPSAAYNPPDVSVDPNLIDLSAFKFNRPTYAGLLGIDQNEKKKSFEVPFTNWLEITIRGIYDSKYNEHLMASFETGRIPTSFPEFVYNWMGHFFVDEITRQVKEVEWWRREQADQFRLQLLLALKNEKSKKVWEIHTFIEFLNEELMVDELAFFLHCRHELFKGPQLFLTPGRFSAVHFVVLTKIFEIIDKVMAKINPNDRSDLKLQLQSKARNKNGLMTLDAGLALRVILEYFIREKKCRYLAVRGLFNLAPKNQNGTLSLKSFKSICNNLDPEAPDSLIIKMYRDAWIMGNGVITHDRFFILANENGFFYRCLRLKADAVPLPLNNYNEINEESSEYVAKMKEAYDAFSHLKQPVALIKDAVRGMGLTDVLESLIKFEELIKNKVQEPLENYRGLTLIDVFKHFWVLCTQAQLAFEECNRKAFSFNIPENIKNLEIFALPRACEGFIETLNLFSIHKLSTRVAIRRIQRMWKARRDINVAATVFKGITKFKRVLKKNHPHPK
ncbi:unnamed protein product [Blepharisma stoltei]|uniref:Uncharacterized protein n=1 Tax=Blepharisma stoltei TaxID=1481888 RepID=A0AAU9IJI3_9CILI|nr:unnamed protein product [Blepharisma stoltei]